MDEYLKWNKVGKEWRMNTKLNEKNKGRAKNEENI